MNGVRDAQQRRVLDVAIELFAEHGFDDVTMADIAEAADVARATVFNYFGSKHGLVETVTESVIVFYREMLDEALAEEHTPAPEQLRTLYAEMGKGIEAHRRLFRSVFREIARIGLGLDEGSVAQRANDEALTRLRALVARGQARGEINDAFDPMTLATAFRSLANGTITNWLYEDATDSLVARMREAADIFLSAVEQPARGATYSSEGWTAMSNAAVAYDPFAPEVQADPYPFYAALREHAPVQYVDSLGAYAVSRHGDVLRVMHDHAAFSSAAMAELVSRPFEIGREGNAFDVPAEDSISIVGLDGADHTRLRTIVNRAFTPRRIGELEDEMRTIARASLAALRARGEGDLMAEFAVPFPTGVIAAILGVDPARRADFRRWSEHMVLAVFEPTTADQRDAVMSSSDEMGEYFDAVFAERTSHPEDDMISLLLRAELEGGALSRDELGVFVTTLLVAGSITTAYLIGSAVMQLVQEPAFEAAVRADPELVEAFAEETLRHESPVQMMFRTATADVEIAGTIVPEGATVLPLLGSANRDERVFVDPDRFDYRRAPSGTLAFGHGVHYCLGAALARLEAKVALEELLRATDVLEQAGTMERITSLVFRGPTVLPLRFG